MYLGDNLIQDSLGQFLQAFKEKNLDALILLRTVSNPTAFGVAKVDEQGRVLALVEKPKVPPSNLALVGLYFFANSIHTAIDSIQPSARGELEITDAIQALINQSQKVEALQLQGWWLDTGKKDDLLAANQIILDSILENNNEGNIDSKSQISGRVTIGKNSQIINSNIRGPVIIGEDCQIENCFIGPFSSVGDRVILQDADLEHSVILQSAQVIGIQQRIVDSVIGQRAKLAIAPQRPKALRFLIGDDSQIELV
jgi:glucose-1-phosphate thymidylyltransferase